MRFEHQQLKLWYGTGDAPAPVDDAIAPRRGASVTVAAQPPGPSNAVIVRYRVDAGPVQSIRAVRLRTDYRRGVEYHRAVFPDFRSGDTVAYLPVLTCSGRSAPDAATALTLPTSFRLGAEAPSGGLAERRPSDPNVAAPALPPDRLPFAMDYLATLRIPLKDPEVIGQTAEGILVNWYWYPAEGLVAGPRLNAKVRRLGGDWMTIRRDGIGLMDVRATLETADGALLYASYNGYFDLGENGYQDFLDRRWPSHAPTRTTPRFHGSHPAYQWLNRAICVGIGEVRMTELVYVYDLYAVR